VQLSTLDWLVVAVYGVCSLAIGLAFIRRASRGTEEFFLSGRRVSWWLLGTSLVATTFSTDTPNLVTDMVRNGGVSQNWLWWAFLLTGMCTVFFYAKLWRRSHVFTDMGFYELRYSGRGAAFLRGFRAVYLGLFFNVVIMATVTLAAIKIGGVLLGLDKYQTVIGAAVLTTLYAASSGLWGVIVTDFFQFGVAMFGAFAAAYYAVRHPAVGGLTGLFEHPEVASRLSLFPDFGNWEAALAAFVIPIAVQWWSTWYPGAEPGGGGYVAQRMLAAKDEREAMRSTLWFNVAHYALRPWPWIIVALASLIVYPSLDTIAARFPHLDPSIVRHDLGYPAMLVFLPHGVLGLVVASLAAAYMSTIATHLNWGSSYLVDDVYRRFWVRNRDERHYLVVARISTVILTLLACALSLWLENALQAFQIMLQIGAGTGLIFLLRWFWWRINVWSELSAMVLSFLVALCFTFGPRWFGFTPLSPPLQLVSSVAITTASWLVVTFLTPAADRATLQAFYDRIRPFARGWRAAVVTQDDPQGSFAAALACWGLGVLTVYMTLFATGYVLYGRWAIAAPCAVAAVLAAWGLFRMLPGVKFE
jgi:Na+/proline symporter